MTVTTVRKRAGLTRSVAKGSAGVCQLSTRLLTRRLQGDVRQENRETDSLVSSMLTLYFLVLSLLSKLL